MILGRSVDEMGMEDIEVGKDIERNEKNYECNQAGYFDLIFDLAPINHSLQWH